MPPISDEPEEIETILLNESEVKSFITGLVTGGAEGRLKLNLTTMLSMRQYLSGVARL